MGDSIATEDALKIVRYWRKDWSWRSQEESLQGGVPSFFLWRSIRDGFESSGALYAEHQAASVIRNPEMAEEVIKLIDQANDSEIVVVMVFEDVERAIATVIEKLESEMGQDWFEMREVRRRDLCKAVWVPLRASMKLHDRGTPGEEGYKEEFYGVGSVMISSSDQDKSATFEWTDIGILNNYTGGVITTYDPNRFEVQSRDLTKFKLPLSEQEVSIQLHTRLKLDPRNEFYTAAGEYAHSDTLIGTGPVIEQHFNSQETDQWHLHQDIVVALRLMREGDSWFSPDEGYIEVARLRRNHDNEPVLLEMRSEHLKDYLKAVNKFLYVSSYRSRTEICADRAHIIWSEPPISEEDIGQRWQGRITKIHEGGMPYGESWSIFHVSRTDVDDDEDVPEFEVPANNNVETSTTQKSFGGPKLYRIDGELWRTEQIEPSDLSTRVMGHDRLSSIEFIVDAAGTKETRGGLVSSGRYLWFKPEVVPVILSTRGALIGWYTRDTGKLSIGVDQGVHFGINTLGLINVYAKDIGLLPDWQQRIWSGFNVAPDGKVSKELLDSQMRAKPAKTPAPERYLRQVYDDINELFQSKYGAPLFRDHQATDEIFDKAHRFRALDQGGLLSLAKDLARLTIESINSRLLRETIGGTINPKWHSIRLLEEFLATQTNAKEPRKLTSVFAGINELRQADAHLPSSELDSALELAGISKEDIPIEQGQQMLKKLVDSIYEIAAEANEAKV